MARVETAERLAKPVRSAELLLLLWRLLASAQFAVALLFFVAVAALLATVIPQVPVPMRDNSVAIDVWVQTKHDTFGVFTEPMQRVGLFNVVDTWWFLTALVMLAVSVCIYTADRLIFIWGNIVRPREQVPDAFFDRAANRSAVATPAGGAARLEALLARRHFRVSSHTADGTTYLFADRFAWAQLAGLVTHLAVIVLLVGGFVTHTRGYTNALLIAEGTTSPVFAVSHPEQMQVKVLDAVGKFDETGSARDYRSTLVIYQGGKEVARGVTTVNHPLSYNGYRFHQAGYLGEGAALTVRDATTGNTIFDEALPLEDLAPAPAITVRDAQGGAVLLRDVIVPTDTIEGTRGTSIVVPGSGRQFWVGLAQDTDNVWHLVVYDRDQPDAFVSLTPGESRPNGGFRWTFEEATGVPTTETAGIPGDGERDTVLLSTDSDSRPYLTLLGPVDGKVLTLYAKQPVRVGDREYEFEGRREFAGIEVRKDPGANFIWLGAGLLLIGLLVTFYVPRLRLWARVQPDETVLASQAERSGVFRAEVKRLARELEAGRVEGEEADA